MTESTRSRDWAAYYQQLRDRPPRRTLLAALDAFGSPPPDALVIDLGCGDGRDAIEMLRRGWHVIAVDSEPEALRQLQARPPPDGCDVTPINARLEDVPIPLGVHLVNSSFAMPLCEPEGFFRTWARIREALPQVGVLVLSQYVEGIYARELFGSGSGHVGYLLKDRVASLDELSVAVRRVSDGGTVLDPLVVQQLVSTAPDPVAHAAWRRQSRPETPIA